jgi:NTE family protein
MKYGLVLSGGGVRGAYQIGVWKALNELGIETAMAVGTSIGAVNGALIAQGEYEKAEKLWSEISADKIAVVPKDMSDAKNLFSIKNFGKIAEQMVKKGGMDMSPFERLLRNVIDEDKIRKSDVRLGISAFSLTDKKEVYKFAEEIPRGALVDYLMACVSLVGFGVRRIDGRKFIDGGMSNNMPVNMVLGAGINDIITVDVRGAGTYRHFNFNGKNVIAIRCEIPQNGIMEFDACGIEKSMAEGYIGCMKAFGQAQGTGYTFRSEDYRRARMRFSEELIRGVESAALIFGADRLKIYTFDELCAFVGEEYKKYLKNNNAVKKENEEKERLIYFTECLKRGKADFFMRKSPFFAKKRMAASALLYFFG